MRDTVSGRFAWHELWTVDAAASNSFYTQVLPWTSELWDKDSGYSLFVGKHGPIAGCHKLGADSNGQAIKPRWNTYIGAANVDSTAALAVQHGAMLVVPAMDIPRVGRFAMLTDPQGAVFGLLSRNEPTAARPMPPPPGSIVWDELLTSDAQAALKFYSQIFGWQLITSIDMGPKGAYLVFGANGESMGGMMTAPIPGGPLWLSYTEVENLEATMAAATRAGAKLCLGPQNVPGGRIANYLDPQGVMFAVHSRPAAVATAAAPKAAAKKSAAKKSAVKKPVAAAARAKNAKRAGATKKKDKRKSSRPVARKAKASARKAAPARRGKSAKRKVARKAAKHASRRIARGKSKRARRR